ncbi:hypothetical protein HAX54_013068 [Datura stramonium]|uniref:Uncharacterized protein n=1 Tax=Datura stramonium TaxID=4076 RepID=A0ABS8S0D3_DATST|nr:hypothetical protein [Datura stramonium]
MVNHQVLLDDFPFYNMIEVPGQGLSGGLVVLWDDNFVELTEVAVTNQEIHAMVQIFDAPAGDPGFQHSFHEQNQVADSLAKEGARKKSDDRLMYFVVSPLFDLPTFEADKVGTSFGRVISNNLCNNLQTFPDNYYGILSSASTSTTFCIDA